MGFFYFLWLMVENMVEAQPHIRTIEDRAAVSLQLLTYQVYIHPCTREDRDAVSLQLLSAQCSHTRYIIYIHPCTREDRDAVSLQLHTITRQCSLDLSDKKMIYSYSTVQYSKVH